MADGYHRDLRPSTDPAKYIVFQKSYIFLTCMTFYCKRNVFPLLLNLNIFSFASHTQYIFFFLFHLYADTEFQLSVGGKTLMAIRSSDVSAESVLQLEAELHFQLCLSIYCKMALIFAADRQALSSWRWSLYLLFQIVATDFQKSMIPVIVYFIIKVTSFF